MPQEQQKLQGSWARWREAALDLLLPPRCAACNSLLLGVTDAQDEPGSCRIFCAACWELVVPVRSACPRCALPGAGHLCPSCCRQPPPQAAAVSAFVYGGQLAQAIWRLKYAGASHLGRPLGHLLARRVVDCLDPGLAGVVAVPLHPKRLRERGFNQAGLLALGIARRLALPLYPQALRRRQESSAQVRLGRQERRENLGAAFQANPRATRGRHLLLVDDVMTTGATVEACSRALLSAGATRVSVLTLARAVP